MAGSEIATSREVTSATTFSTATGSPARSSSSSSCAIRPGSCRAGAGVVADAVRARRGAGGLRDAQLRLDGAGEQEDGPRVGLGGPIDLEVPAAMPW